MLSADSRLPVVVMIMTRLLAQVDIIVIVIMIT